MSERREGCLYVAMEQPPGPLSQFVELEDWRGRSLSGQRWLKEGELWLLELPGPGPNQGSKQPL